MKETYYGDDGKPEGIPSELADVILRILDMCAHYRIDIGRHACRKEHIQQNADHTSTEGKRYDE